MFRIRNLLFDGGSGGSAALTLSAMDTIGDIRNDMKAVVERINALADSKGNVPAAAIGDITKELKRISDMTADHEKVIKANLTPDPTKRAETLSNLYLRLTPPKGMSREHFNLITLAPEELGYAAELGKRGLPGLSERTERFLRSSLDDNTQARISELQAVNDALLICDNVMGADPNSDYATRSGSRLERIKTLRLYPQWERMVGDFKRGLNEGAAASGGDWVPTMLSSRLQELIQAQLSVAALFGSITMPSPTYDSPVLGLDAISYYIAAESTSDDPTGAGTAGHIPGSSPLTRKMRLTAKKLGTRILATSEVQEDSAINMVQLILAQIAKATRRAIEDAILNGDVAATHQDNGITGGIGATDRRKAWDGLRKISLISGMVNTDLTTFNGDNLLAMKQGMGVYGIDPSQGAWIVDFRTYVKLLSLKDVNNNMLVQTIQQLGAAATILTGQLGVLFGSPVIVSEFMPNDTDNTKVRVAGGTKSEILYVNRESFTRGERRSLTINRADQRYAEFDMVVFVGTYRGDFEPWYPTTTAGSFTQQKTVALGYNIA